MATSGDDHSMPVVSSGIIIYRYHQIEDKEGGREADKEKEEAEEAEEAKEERLASTAHKFVQPCNISPPL